CRRCAWACLCGFMSILEIKVLRPPRLSVNCKLFAINFHLKAARPGSRRGGANWLLHQQHLARALDGEGQAALVMRRHPGVFPRQDAALVGHILPEQIGVLVIERIGGKVYLRLRTRRAFFHLAAARTAAVLVGMGFAWHGYLISR